MIPAANTSARASAAYSNFRDGNDNAGGEIKRSGTATELTVGSNSGSRAFNGFYKDRILRGVAQRIAQSLDGAADGTVKIDKNILRPKRLPEFFARHNFIPPAEQDSERAKGQARNLYPDSFLPQCLQAPV